VNSSRSEHLPPRIYLCAPVRRIQYALLTVPRLYRRPGLPVRSPVAVARPTGRSARTRSTSQLQTRGRGRLPQRTAASAPERGTRTRGRRGRRRPLRARNPGRPPLRTAAPAPVRGTRTCVRRGRRRPLRPRNPGRPPLRTAAPAPVRVTRAGDRRGRLLRARERGRPPPVTRRGLCPRERQSRGWPTRAPTRAVEAACSTLAWCSSTTGVGCRRRGCQATHVYWALFFAGTVVLLTGTCQFFGPARQEVSRKKKPRKGKKIFLPSYDWHTLTVKQKNDSNRGLLASVVPVARVAVLFTLLVGTGRQAVTHAAFAARGCAACAA